MSELKKILKEVVLDVKKQEMHLYTLKIAEEIENSRKAFREILKREGIEI